jgi:hypothetical protein
MSFSSEEERAYGAREFFNELAQGACKGGSIAALGLFGAAYFVVLSFGAIMWIGLAASPWLMDPVKFGAHWGIDPKAWLWLGSAIAWGSFAATGKKIAVLAKPHARRIRPGGSWAASALMHWLVWLDAALLLGREPPDCLGGPGWVAKDGAGLGRLAWSMCRGWARVPARAMAICWGLVLISAMPLGLHLAMAVWVPAAVVSILMPGGPAIGLMERVKLVALDLAKEGSAEWAQAEREEIDEEIERAMRERMARLAKKGRQYDSEPAMERKNPKRL